MATVSKWVTVFAIMSAASSSGLAPVAESAEQAVKKVEISNVVVFTIPQSWSLAAAQYSNARTLATLAMRPGSTVPLATILITTERRSNHADAVQRLRDIAKEVQSEPSFLEIGGWPAVQRRRLAPLARSGQEADATDSEREEGRESALQVTIAIAAGDLLVRLEGSLAPGADPILADQVERISQTAEFSSQASPGDVDKELQSLRHAMLETAPGAAVVVLDGRGELEVAASNDGQNVVIASNTGFSVSGDGGATFVFRGGTPGAFDRDGDPSLAVGANGTFYYGFVGFPDGSSAAGNVTGCSTAVAASTDNGLTFSFRSHAVLCPRTGPSLCFPDQAHIAADRVNTSASGGDQVYSVWRNFTPSSPVQTCDAATIGFATPAIVCSPDGGASWSAPAVIGTGDIPRISVGPDGFVYAMYRNGTGLLLNKFSSCSDGLVQQIGFPVTIGTVADVACPVAGVDRCNDGNFLSSHMVAVDDTNANHVYISYATNTLAGNEDIVVRDSSDGGRTWGPAVRLNAPISARRFLPWMCTMDGSAYVTWYDRRAANVVNNDLTDYYIGSASVRGGLLHAGPEANLSVNADPQCAAGFPCGARAVGDWMMCSVPTNGFVGGGCPKYGDYNGNACAAGRIYAAWTSATTPPGTAAGTGLRIFSSTVAVSDVYVRDWTDSLLSGDDGAQPSNHPFFYTTSDVWNRRGTQPGMFPNDQPENEDAGNGVGNGGDNWAFARVRRRPPGPSAGSSAVAAHFLVSKLGTGSNFVDAASMDPDVSFPDPDPTITFNPGDIGPTTTTAYHWHLNPLSSPHLCLTVEIAAVGDPFVSPGLRGFAPGWPTTDLKIIDDNNKAQRNMGLSTTPARGTGGSARLSYYAIAHNAATFPRDMQLRFEAAPEVVERFKNARVEVIGGVSQQLKSGDTLTLHNMQPGENRWIGLSFDVPDGKVGEVLPVYFFELVQGSPVNGFAIAIRPSDMSLVIVDNLRLHNSLYTRLAAGLKLPGAVDQATAAQELIERGHGDPSKYVEFLNLHEQGMNQLLDALIEVWTFGDPFEAKTTMKELSMAIESSAIERASVLHMALLNKLDSFLTMVQLAEGDDADIVQNVRWQRELYAKVLQLRELSCSENLSEVSEQFVSAYSTRMASNNEYRKLIHDLMGCFIQTAEKLSRTKIDLSNHISRMKESMNSVTKLQKAHRDYLLDIQALVN